MNKNIENSNEDRYILSVKNLTKLYGLNKNEAVKMLKAGAEKNEVFKKTGVTSAIWDMSFDVKQGEIFVIIGLSGSGKSTVIRCLNRLHNPTSGTILFDGKDIGKFSQKELTDFRRNKISMVFQNFGLMSHRDVINNIEYGLEIKGISKEEREKKAMEVLKMVGLEGLEHANINSLSGGMKQRVGIARALANDPEILLMDEPFSALDPLVRSDMQFELLSIQKKLKKTIIFITHDINEAFKLGDKVAIMKDSRLIQLDTPENMSANPADDYVRQFIDSADKTKVISVKQIMFNPSCIIRLKEGAGIAIREMKSNRVSSAYVIDNHMKFLGIITIDNALKCRNENGFLSDYIFNEIPTTSSDALINDILPIAANTKFPIAVIDNGELMGIVSKASILSTLI
ncbi:MULTISPECIES: quaternary amine ABC transporter ATP-binding protein [Fusobacterium]|jgi:glycine betaine/proline transport system ATP-binding protein|uniref:quaternary amine ABC transporter ATP-binding protein n=1 Tax=Fusobacterium TaxID=848 RepID=UPI000E7F076F|nr:MULTISPECIES: glycine betaine/L-proline ABC transporter ATP-binding protein [Fusobacterium]HBJ77896.1 glycine betaine/L-proline ABC transporter ATP-binding protein [Fusobacterium sp.]